MNMVEKKSKEHFPWVLCVSGLVMLTGCVTEPKSGELEFGSSVRNAQIKQTMGKKSGQTTQSFLSSDGVIAKSAIDRYQSSYEVPLPPVNIMNIGLGGTHAGAGR